ncbi:hypothetical protein [Paenibacillus larvae]|uniref:hypothetical protein n=1 Tax=Paenibacillus larvae TaxID=1464 RepID=UPI0002D6633B|nr:hypothetical protein [Paenibacillus larvae]ETK27381.1 hypothetical protein ERIC1_1c08260 [Paenibacillus larvae subsp. larvae DSM 25719]MDT2245982.1 hypothetical protein [Paenibacillus larvae]MDT2268169.1 hypothetical protein [Paenibacillus larvae]MDT2277894.1 hypothetical protein [Paenibacillus larvae]MDT2288946.1 hypothetical protein [Paenibacillus larvae]
MVKNGTKRRTIVPNRNIEPNGEVNSEVITYTLTPEELEEVRERTKHLNKYNRKTMVDVRVKTRRKK